MDVYYVLLNDVHANKLEQFPKISYAYFSDEMAYANSADPDQTVIPPNILWNTQENRFR